MSTQELDAAKLEAFGGRMLGVLNDGFLALLVSIGHRTGLFDLMADMPPSTSAEIAEAAALDERYVRELLGGLAVGGIVEYAGGSERFSLPPEHAALVTRAAGGDNMAFFTQYVSPCALGEHERFDLITAFDVVHDLARPAETLAGIREALRPGGTFLMVDIQASSNLEENLEHPLGALLYGASVFHCMTVSLAQGGPGL